MIWIVLLLGIIYVTIADRRDSKGPQWADSILYLIIGAIPLNFPLVSLPLGLVVGPLAVLTRVQNPWTKLFAALLGALLGWLAFNWLGFSIIPPGG